MNHDVSTGVAGQAATESTNIVYRQIDAQAHSLGDRVAQTAKELEAVAEHVRHTETISSVANVIDWAARNVAHVAHYLSSGNTKQFIGDFETFGRQRPWAVAGSTAALGFVAARIAKSSVAGDVKYVDTQAALPRLPDGN